MLHAVKVATIVPSVRRMERERKNIIRNSKVKLASSKAWMRMSVRMSEGENRTDTSELRAGRAVG